MGKKIGIIDADLLDRGTRFPNLSLMKIAGYQQDKGNEVILVESYDDVLVDNDFDELYMGKVFDFTKIPINIAEYKNLKIGGTGFFFERSFDEEHRLPEDIEHHMPLYSLYDNFIQHEIQRGINPNKFTDYQYYSIGFTTRGCVRQCPFCVNQNSYGVQRWSPVSEFLDDSRPKIYLWDDNIRGFGHYCG